MLHPTLSANAVQSSGDDDPSSITNTADLFLAWIGRRKTLLAYSVIFAAGAVRSFGFVPPRMSNMLTCGRAGIANDSKW